MTNQADWKSLFLRWPQEIPRRGVLVTSFDEQILFVGFLVGEGFLLAERHAPDTMGGRTLLVPYENIAAVKLTDVVKEKTLHDFGFQGSLPKK
jgi:hypothetical protein